VQPIRPLVEAEPPLLYYEVLIRIRDEKGNIVLPARFMPNAERQNLSLKIDRWVLDSILHQLAEHPKHTGQVGLCGINVALETVTDRAQTDDYAATMQRLLRETKVAPERICIEVPERAAALQPDHTARFCYQIRALGCRVALDDFGSGGISLLALKEIAIDQLKIDGAFGHRLEWDPYSLAVVKAVRELAQARGLQVVAKGVEDLETLDLLRTLGVDFAQGYAVAQPLPAEGFFGDR
jgi:EAL domain-containing protein (putative c-di-GMP-specific phosphodiesterase class I)